MRNSQERSVVVRRAFVKQVPATQRPPQPEKEFRPRLYYFIITTQKKGAHTNERVN